jgi:hybrid cluster-associated redox disulfide protein
MDIDKNTLISNIIKAYPSAISVLDKYNMSCASCLGLQNESLEKGCLMHGLDVNEVIKELNALKENL